MKNDDNFLSDIEDDIFGDWEEIQKKLKNKDQEKGMMENPQRLNCPDFMEFYQTLLRILQSWDFHNPDPHLLKAFHELLRMVFWDVDINSNSNPFPTSFHRLWEIVCSPREFKCDKNVICNHCNKEWDIFFKQGGMRIQDIWRNGGDMGEAANIAVESSRVACPDCGYEISVYMGMKVMGVIRSVHDGERVTADDFRKQFEDRF